MLRRLRIKPPRKGVSTSFVPGNLQGTHECDKSISLVRPCLDEVTVTVLNPIRAFAPCFV